MTRSLLVACVVAFFFSIAARAETNVTVRVGGIVNASGNLVVTVFDSKKNWLKRPLDVERIALDADSPQPTEVRFSLPAGAYAFHVFHDLDSNGKMKTNFIGIPKEPTGVSNAAKGRFGPPKFKDAVVNIDDGNCIVDVSLVEI